MSRRIGGAGGGSDPGSSKSAQVVVATATAVVVAAGGAGTIGGGAAVTSSTSSAAQSALARNLGAKKVDARNAARRGDTRGAWQRMGLRQMKTHVERYVDCVAHSVGDVQDFLVRTPCRRLDRTLLTLADGDGNLMVVAVAWIEFRGRRDARTFQDVSDTYGTGYITPVGGVVLDLADIRLTGQHYASRAAGAMIVTAEAEPVHGRVDDAVLDAVAEVVVWVPRR